MGRLYDFQTALKPLEKLKYIFMTILGLAELFKMMNQPDPARPDPKRPSPSTAI